MRQMAFQAPKHYIINNHTIPQVEFYFLPNISCNFFFIQSSFKFHMLLSLKEIHTIIKKNALMLSMKHPGQMFPVPCLLPLSKVIIYIYMQTTIIIHHINSSAQQAVPLHWYAKYQPSQLLAWAENTMTCAQTGNMVYAWGQHQEPWKNWREEERCLIG